MKTNFSYIISGSNKSLTLNLEGKVYSVSSTHANHKLILDKLKQVAKRGTAVIAKELKPLLNVAKAMSSFTRGKVEVVNGKVVYNGQTLHNYACKALLSLMSEGFDSRPLVNFLSRLMLNPSEHSREHLYKFAEAQKLPITEEGKIVAFKIVTHDYLDRHTRTIRNKVGDAPEMNRALVGDDINNVCGSAGLYVGGFSYTHQFGRLQGDQADRVMIIEIDPADFVCIPNGEADKARVCRYTVVSELNDVEREEYIGGRDILSEGKVFNRTQKRDPNTGLFVSGWEETDAPVATQVRDSKGRFGPKQYTGEEEEQSCGYCGVYGCEGDCDDQCEWCGESDCDGTCDES